MIPAMAFGGGEPGVVRHAARADVRLVRLVRLVWLVWLVRLVRHAGGCANVGVVPMLTLVQSGCLARARVSTYAKTHAST